MVADGEHVKLAAIVVSHSLGLASVERCLQSVRSAGAERIVLVDNGGRFDWQIAAVDIVHTSNAGFGAAVNLGVRRVPDADRLLVLNDDLTVEPAAIGHLCDALDHGVAVAQPMLVRADSRPAVVNSLGVSIDRYGAGTDIGAGTSVDQIDDTPRPIEIFTGGAFLATREFWDATGGFDERYWLYYEDVDLALRGAELGFDYAVVPAARVHHAGGLSTGSIPHRTRYLQERNRLWSMARFGRPRQLGAAVWLSARRLARRPRRVHARALLAGLSGIPRRVLERWRARRFETR